MLGVLKRSNWQLQNYKMDHLFQGISRVQACQTLRPLQAHVRPAKILQFLI